MAEMKKIIEKISNLLDLAGNNPSENEAIAAALKAQELMAKYHVELADLSNQENEKIIREACETGSSGVHKWRMMLANILAENFCCQMFIDSAKRVVFYGYQQDARIAKEVFLYLYQIGNRLARQQYTVAKREGRCTKYLQNTFLMGYCSGIKDVLGKQCTALMVVVPEEVKRNFKEEILKNSKPIHRSIRSRHDGALYEKGVRAGKDAASARMLESAS